MNDGARLLKLQETDLELQRLQLELAKLPELIELQRLRKHLARAREEMLKVKGARKDIETDLSDLADEEAYYREQVEGAQAKAARLTDYREVQDLEIELSNLAKALDKIAFDQRERESALDRVLEREAKGTTAIERLETQVKAQAVRAREVATDLQERIAAAKADRERLHAALGEELQRAYEQAAASFKGLGVEALHDDTPTLCRTKLMESSLDEVKRAGQITECPYCHRILVIDADDEGDAS